VTGTRVLVVEDNAVNRELMDSLLGAFGYEPLLAADGLTGLAMAREHRPSLVICDIRMPHLDGYGFARAVRADPALAGLRLLAVTASAMSGEREHILAAGFDAYLAKPIDPVAFVETLQGLMPAPRPVPTPAAATPSPDRPSGERGMVLVLDDTHSNLVIVRDLLEPHGYEVLTASQADEAWALALARTPRLIVSDVGMQHGSGFDFIRRVKGEATLRGVPFVFLTATHWDSASESIGRGLGAVRYLRRPIDPRLLLAELEAVLGG
jgi:two-component system cell cycle response regulator